MTFLAPIFGALLPAAGGAAAAGTTAAAAATGISGMSVLSVLSGAASVMGTLGTMAASKAEATSLTAQAAQEDLDADRESNLGMQRRTALKRELLSVLGENDVRAAAAGIDLGAGLVQDMNESAEQRTVQELSIDRSDQEYRAAQRRARASSLRSQASSARRAGAMKAAGGLLSSALTMGGA